MRRGQKHAHGAGWQLSTMDSHLCATIQRSRLLQHQHGRERNELQCSGMDLWGNPTSSGVSQKLRSFTEWIHPYFLFFPEEISLRKRLVYWNWSPNGLATDISKPHRPRLVWSNCILLSFEFAHRMFQVQVCCGCRLVVMVPLCEFAAKLRLYNWMLGSTSEHKRTHCIPKFREAPRFNAPPVG